MKYHQIIATLREQPLLLTPASHGALLQMFERHIAMNRDDFLAAREGIGVCGESVELDQAANIDRIMHIPITGPLGWRLGKMEKGAGAIDYQDVIDELSAADEDDDVDGIVLVIDSPGGMVAGCEETANRIVAMEKPVYAFAAGQCCSAAYWLASACESIHATTSADVGAIGVYCYVLDRAKQMEMAGVKAEVITSGKFKGMGAPGVSLSTDQREMLQDRINKMAETFYSHVNQTRDVGRESMQGQVFGAKEAVELGLIDAIVADVSEVADLLRG